VVKNKVAPPFREAEFDILYGEGISLIGDLLDVAVERDIVEKSGSWYSYSGERIGQGRDNARLFLKDHAETLAKVEGQVRDALGLARVATAPPPAPEPPARTASARAAKG
jgi:recombination protein RecA